MSKRKLFVCADCEEELRFDLKNPTICKCNQDHFIEDYWESWVPCYICGKDYCMDHDDDDQRNAFMKSNNFKDWYLCFSCEWFDVDLRQCEEYDELPFEMFHRKRFCKYYSENTY